MLRSFCRWSRLRSFSTAESLLPQIKDEAASSETAGTHTIGTIEAARSQEEAAAIDAPKGSVLLSVGANSDLRGVAARLANAVRDQEKDASVLLRATGPVAVNHAVKCIRMAKRFLAERPGIHIGFSVNHQKEADKTRISKIMFLIRQIEQQSEVPSGLDEMWVSKFVNGKRIGEKMTSALENTENAAAFGIGPRSVGNMILGLTWARRMLYAKQQDAVAIPDSLEVSARNDGTKLSALRLMLMRVPYERLHALDVDEPFV